MWTRTIEKLAGLPQLDSIIKEAASVQGDASIFAAISCTLGLGAITWPASLARISRVESLIVVANCPTGFAEGFVVAALVDAVRPDIKVVSHPWFERWPALARHMILTDIFRASARHLYRGGCVVLFPAGEVSHAPEKPWGPLLGRLVRLTGATVLPVHVSGNRDRRFEVLANMHPRLGPLWLGRELLERQGQDIEVRIGRSLPASDLRLLGEPEAVADRCRRAVLDLGRAPARQSQNLVRIRGLRAREVATTTKADRSTARPEGAHSGRVRGARMAAEGGRAEGLDRYQ